MIDDWLIDNAPVQLKELAIPGKIQTGGGGSWGHGISRGIEERACENSRGQLKKKEVFKLKKSTVSSWPVFAKQKVQT